MPCVSRIKRRWDGDRRNGWPCQGEAAAGSLEQKEMLAAREGLLLLVVGAWERV